MSRFETQFAALKAKMKGHLFLSSPYVTLLLIALLTLFVRLWITVQML